MIERNGNNVSINLERLKPRILILKKYIFLRNFAFFGKIEGFCTFFKEITFYKFEFPQHLEVLLFNGEVENSREEYYFLNIYQDCFQIHQIISTTKCGMTCLFMEPTTLTLS